MQKYHLHKKKRFTKLLDGFQKHTLWLQNMGSVVDVVVQTQAGIGCPVWAPIKFVLKVSDDHAQAVEQTLNIIRKITECLPRFEIYEKLQGDAKLQVAFLNVFTDVVEFSVRACQFFRRKSLVRLSRIIGRTFDQELGDIVAQLERHAKVADQTAVATELLRASEHRSQIDKKHRDDLRIQCENWLRPSNVRAFHDLQVNARLAGTCSWITSNDSFRKWINTECLESLHRLLCISGTHGCGKSVLSSSIVVDLEKEDNYVLFFSFSSTDATRRIAENLLRTLLWQLVQKNITEKSIETLGRLILQGQATASELWQAFGTIMQSANCPIFCVIGGIDECTDFDTAIFGLIHDLINVCPNFRAVLLGRPHTVKALLQSINEGVVTVHISPTTVSHDIEAFIVDEISNSEILRLPNVCDKVSTTLKEMSDGMFLWVK